MHFPAGLGFELERFLPISLDMSDEDKFSDDEIARRMEAGVRRALNTPPTPTRELVGKTERAQEQRAKKKRKSPTKKPGSKR